MTAGARPAERRVRLSAVLLGLGVLGLATLHGCSGQAAAVADPPVAGTSGDPVVLQVPPPRSDYEVRRDPDTPADPFADLTDEATSVAEGSRYLAAHLPADRAYFLQISDIHIGDGAESHYPPFGNSGLEFLVKTVKPTPRSQRVFREILGLRPPPAFIIITGDFTGHGMRDELEASKSLLPREGPPLYIARGNHDWDLQAFLDVFGDWRLMEPERMRTTGVCYGFDVAGTHYVVLDSESIVLDGPELQWFEADMASHAGVPVVVFNHRDLLPVGYLLSDTRPGFLQAHADKILAIMHAHPRAKWIFGGHVHLNTWRMDGDINLITITSTFYDNADARTTLQGWAGLYAHLVHTEGGEVRWVARKQFAGATVQARPPGPGEFSVTDLGKRR